MSDRPERKLTDQQLKAVETRGVSVVLSSGAGCGKTSVLTDRYLSHLERDHCEVHQLAAITFTDKAAREMRHRIRQAIERKILSATGSEKDNWEQHLRGLESAAISTIHSFCGQLLRRFAFVAGLDPAFEILEESIAPNLRESAVRDTLYELLVSENNEGQALQELVRWYGWARVRQTIEQLVLVRDHSAWAEWLSQTPAQIAGLWRTLARNDVIPKQLHELSTSGPIADAMQLLRTTPCPNDKFAENAAAITNAWDQLEAAKDPAAILEQITLAARVQGVVKKDSWDTPGVYESVQKQFENLRKCIKDKVAPLFVIPTDLDSAAEFGQRFLRVALVCSSAYEDEKRRRGFVDFQDLLVMARDLLRDHADVRRECQRAYRFILVDELQDTDRVQMELLDLLCGNDKTKGKLFAVGDAKQSIYRFRGAEVEEFIRLRDAMPENGQQSLTYNFRSQRQILHFVNALLKNDIEDYEPLQAKVEQVNPDPCIEFLWSPAEKLVIDSRRGEAKRIAQTIAAMVANQEPIVSERPKNGSPKLRPVQPKDVVLLFRAMTNVGNYEEALRSAGLDYYLVGGRAFFAQQEIYDVLNLLRVLENPHDALSLAGVLRSPFGCVSDEGLYVLAQHAKGLWKGLHDSAPSRVPIHDRGPVERIGKWLLAWRADKDRLTIAGLLNRVLTDSGYDAALRYENLAKRKLANLWKLIDLARAFDRVGGFTLADFVERLSDLVNTPPREEQAATQPEESNVVRLMSIHQAKGLEFPVVFLPDLNAKAVGERVSTAEWDDQLGCVPQPPADEDPPPFSEWPSKLWSNKERLEERAEALRIFYVACTRARDYLVLSASIDFAKEPQNTAMRVLNDRFDLVTGTCKDNSIPMDEQPQVRVTPREIDLKSLPLQRINDQPPPLTAADARRVQTFSS